MHAMSFQLTIEQIRARTKTVTRRLGWGFLRPGAEIRAVEKRRGLKKGQHPVELAVLRVTHVWQEPLNRITEPEVEREGFAGMTAEAFVSMFCREMACTPDALVTRIGFEYADEVPL